MPSTTRFLGSASLAAALLAAMGALSAHRALAAEYATPLAVRGGETVFAAIEPSGDVDEFGVHLFAGDVLTVKLKEQGPTRGLESTLTLLDPTGSDTRVTVKGQGTFRASFTWTAERTGTHLVRLRGDSGTLASSHGDYSIAFKVKRGKPPKGSFADAAGGSFVHPFAATAGASVSITASTRKGTLDVAEIRRPDGTAEPVAIPEDPKGRKAKLKKYVLTGDDGTYEVRGTYTAGAAVKLVVKVDHDDAKRNRRFGVDEPRITDPFPTSGITGTRFFVAGNNFTFEDHDPVVAGVDPFADPNDLDLYPRFFLGTVEVPRASIDHPNGAIFIFDIPQGLTVGESHDLRAVNADGQGSVYEDAFFVSPPPVVTGMTPTDAGPAGGRRLTITGTELGGTVVIFDGTIVQPSIRDGVITVIAPPHAPGDVTVTVRDEHGQEADVPMPLRYLDVPSNRVDSVSPTYLQALGGETVTVTGEDFGADTVLTLGGTVVPHESISSTQLRFASGEHVQGTFDLRVTDQYEQTSHIDVEVRGFADTTSVSIPAPNTGTNAADGWRATRVLSGDVNGDNNVDLVLLRPEVAFGGDAQRSRIRLLHGNGAGGFTDVTAAKLPAVTEEDDWRARDGVLADFDGDGDLDLAVITDEVLDDGDRSSLRLLRNASGTFTDVTDTKLPGKADYDVDDSNQGLALVAANVDGSAGIDLVLIHADYFTRTVVTEGPPPTPPDPPIPPTIEYFYYPGTRVLVNDGAGAFARKADALPAITPEDSTQFQGNALVAGDVDGDSDVDLVLTVDEPVEDPENSGTYFRAATLLRNDGSGVFADVSASSLPAPNGAEYLQGDRLHLAPIDSGSSLDLVVVSDTRLVTPGTSTLATGAATRIFVNDGSGSFATATAPEFPPIDALDSWQAAGIAIGDLNGDSRPELVLVSNFAPNTRGHGGRILVQEDGDYRTGSDALPNPLVDDDTRGADVLLLDVDEDGDLDLVIVRDEPNETLRHTRVLLNPRL